MLNFGDSLKDLMISNDLNVETLSVATGIPMNDIYNWCADLFLPNVTHLQKLVDFFDCSLDYLIGREVPESNPPPQAAYPPFPEHLKKIIRTSKKSKTEISRETGITRSQIYNLLTGKSVPTLYTLIKLADFFKVSLDYLIGRA